MDDKTQTQTAAPVKTSPPVTAPVDSSTLTPQPKVAVVPIPPGATETQIAHLINQSQNVLDAANTQRASKNTEVDPTTVKAVPQNYTFTDSGDVIEATSTDDALKQLNANKKDNK